MYEIEELRKKIEAQDYIGALQIIDEIDEMSREDKLNKIYSYMVILLAIAFLVIEFNPRSFLSPIQLITKPECIIKGNISLDTGNKIYHLRGMEDYESTVIDSFKGEKWFCSESEAIANG